MGRTKQKEPKTIIGVQIQTFRKGRGLSPKQLANKARISLASVYNYESGDREPKASDLQKIAKALGQNIDSLLDARAEKFHGNKGPKILESSEPYARQKEKDFPTASYGELSFEQRLLVKTFTPLLFSDDQEMKKHILKQLQYFSELLKTREMTKPNKKKEVGT